MAEIDGTPFTPDEIYLSLKLKELTSNDWIVCRDYDKEQSDTLIRMCRPDWKKVYALFVSSFDNKSWLCIECYPETMQLPFRF